MVLHAVLSHSMPSTTTNPMIQTQDDDSFSEHDSDTDENNNDSDEDDDLYDDNENNEEDGLLESGRNRNRNGDNGIIDHSGDVGRGFDRLSPQLSQDDIRALRLFFNNDIIVNARDRIGNGFELRRSGESRRRHRRRLEDVWIETSGREFGLNNIINRNNIINNNQNNNRNNISPNNNQNRNNRNNNRILGLDNQNDINSSDSEVETPEIAHQDEIGPRLGGNRQMFANLQVGEPKDFFVGFVMGFFLGIIMLFWIWEAHVREKEMKYLYKFMF